MGYSIIYFGESEIKIGDFENIKYYFTLDGFLRGMESADIALIDSGSIIDEEGVAKINKFSYSRRVPIILYLGERFSEAVLNGCKYMSIIRQDDRNDIVNSLIKNIVHKHSQMKKIASEGDLLDLFLKYSTSYVFFKDENARVLKLSENYVNMLGIPASEAIGKNMMEIFPSDLAKTMVEDDLKILIEGKVIEVVEQLNGKYYKTNKFPVIREGKPPILAGFTVDISDLKETEKALKDSKKLIEDRSITDELLSISNRRGFLKEFDKEIERVKRYGIPSTLILIDIDKFKSLNDSLGHFKADNVLKDFSKKIKSILRTNDHFGRIGGDEFAIICVSTPIEKGITVANRIKKLLMNEPVCIDEIDYTYSVSMGLIEIINKDDDIQELLHNADKALYEAKREGGDSYKIINR